MPTQAPLQDDTKHAQLDRILFGLNDRFNGGGGNCAAVACVLGEVLWAGGDFVVVSGEHYQFADHVFLRWQG